MTSDRSSLYHPRARAPRGARAALATTLFGACLLLAACGAAPSPEVWRGTSTVADRSSPLRLELDRTPAGSGVRLEGRYTVGGGATGSLEGYLAGGAIDAGLHPSGDCSYALTGTLAGDTLTATFEPDDCPGGVGGSWALERE